MRCGGICVSRRSKCRHKDVTRIGEVGSVCMWDHLLHRPSHENHLRREEQLRMVPPRMRVSTLAVIRVGLCLIAVAGIAVPAKAEPVKVTNLVSDGPIPAQITDPFLVNPW